MERTNAEKFRSNLKEWMEMAREEPIKITRKSGESFILVRAEEFEEMRLKVARFDGLTASLIDVIQGRVSFATDESLNEIFEESRKKALAMRRAKTKREAS